MNRPKRSTCLAVFTAVIMCSGAALASVQAVAPAAFPSRAPAPGPALPLQLPQPVTQTLANGLQVISVPRAGLPLVTAELVLRRGSEMDPPSLAGLSELTASLLSRGAARQGAPQLAAAADALGGSLHAAAGWDATALDITVTTPRLAQALALMAEVARRPDFSEGEFRRAQAQAIDAVQLSLSRPIALAELAACRSVFGDGAYGHARSGTPASLAQITRADVLRLHAQLYRPDDAILILAGDVTPAQAQQLAQASFGDWTKPATPLPARPPGRRAGGLPPIVLIDQPGAGQAAVVVAHAAPPRQAAGDYVGMVANAVLGGSYSARLNEQIRIKRGLSYGASSRLETRAGAGLWVAAAQTRNPAAPQVLQLMLDQLRRLGHARVPDAELAARKAALIGSYGRSLQTTAGLAQQVGTLAVYGLPLDRLGQYAARVQAVTAKQVEAYARAHLDADGLHLVVVGDAAQFAAAIGKQHPKAVLLQAATLDPDPADLRAPSAASTR